jgi:23S rRNA (adenine2030-N6)-methyltransferase
MTEASPYKHEDHAGNHADVLKHVILCSAIRELQKIHPGGILLSDAHCGFGVYDLMLQETSEYKDGIGRVLKRYESEEESKTTPPAIRDYIKTTLEAVGADGSSATFELYPGSPLLAQTLLRPKIDEHRLCDLYLNEVEGLSSSRIATFQSLDCYDPESLEFLMPSNSTKHPVILIDASYKEMEEYGKVKQLVELILQKNSLATVLIWIPFIAEHRFRYSFATGLRNIAKEQAKTGRYYANIVISKTGLQGSAMLICNPPPLLDDVVDPKALHWLAHVMNRGKDEYTVEQIMKKKKKGPLEK